ncbi:MAG: hypothetical protein ACRDOA_14125 [Streptosporangiaceae bacterium]
MAFRRGRTRLTYLGVLGCAALAVALGGCSSAAGPAQAVTSAEHSLTIAQAQVAYRSYVTASTAAAKQGDATNGLAVVADGQWAIVHAQYRALATTGTPVPRYGYGTPAFYVPALSGYPQWFVAAVPVTPAPGAPAVTTIMAFDRPAPDQPWTLNGSAVLNRPLPAIARDAAGYAVNVSTKDTSLLLPPEVVGATQAAVVDEGPTAPAAAAIDNGPQTTGMYTTQAAQGSSYTAQGLSYLWLLEGAAVPQFDLRTTDGGALVIYTMYLNTTIEHPGDAFGPRIPIPAGFAPIANPATATGAHGVAANWTYEFATVDPPATAHGARAQVIAASGAPTFGDSF